MKLDTFKKHLDKWLRGISDTPKIDDYGVAVGAETNSVTRQNENREASLVIYSEGGKRERNVVRIYTPALLLVQAVTFHWYLNSFGA
ncbi:MAG: hypothetical protein GY810_31705, partial [Aureispira sp.]|nr:hypothetical protein [Aureispira sp.]